MVLFWKGPKNSSGSPKKPEYLAIIIEIGERLFLLPCRKLRSTPEFVRSDQRAIVGDARSVLGYAEEEGLTAEYRRLTKPFRNAEWQRASLC
jgi:hypothetical protein